MSNWTIYILRCADNSLYTGIAIDLEKRIDEHNHCDRLGSKYVRPRRPATLVYQETSDSRANASRREAEIKKLSKAKKETLVGSPDFAKRTPGKNIR